MVTSYTRTDPGFIAPGSDQHAKLITASKVASILGVSRWESAYSLWHRMKGNIVGDPPKDIYTVGHAFELALAELWKLEHPGWRLSHGEVQFVTPDFGFPAMATVDRRATRGRMRQVVEFKVARALACETPIKVPGGWKKMGDLRIGDSVYAPDGSPTRVTNTSPIYLNNHCYRVTFRDGQELVADEDHLWQVVDHDRARAVRIMTTGDIANVGLRRAAATGYRFRVPVTEAIEDVHALQTLDPWVLGMWLGDGSTGHGRIACGEPDLEYVCRKLTARGFGWQIQRYGTCPVIAVTGLCSALRAAGVLNRKHIPHNYMHCSVDQRRELLAGLLDSDGSFGDHQVALGMVNEPLMRQALELVRSLGYRATLRRHKSSLHGQQKKDVHWVKFSADGDNPFGMPRKATKFTEASKRRGKGSHSLKFNAIVAIEPVGSVPVRCITIDHPSSLYLAGKGFAVTHNSLEDWGDPTLSGDLPMDYVTQVIFQQMVSNITSTADVVVMGPWFKHFTYNVEYDELIANWITRECLTFWQSLHDDTAPELDDSVSTYACVKELHPDIDGTEVEVTADLIMQLRELREEIGPLQATQRGLKSQLLDLMGKAQKAHINGEVVARRQRHSRGGVTLTVL